MTQLIPIQSVRSDGIALLLLSNDRLSRIAWHPDINAHRLQVGTSLMFGMNHG